MVKMKKIYLALIVGILLVGTTYAGVSLISDRGVSTGDKLILDKAGISEYNKTINYYDNKNTKEICFYPGRNIEDQCRGCLIYSDCTCSAKFSPEDQLKPRRNEVKVKVIAVFD